MPTVFDGVSLRSDGYESLTPDRMQLRSVNRNELIVSLLAPLPSASGDARLPPLPDTAS